MKGFLAWRLGWRAFAARGPRATSRLLLASSLAMALGLVPLVVVLSIADGMIEGISLRTIETSLYHVQAWSLGASTSTQALRASLNSDLSKVPGFRGAWPEQQGFALAYAPSGRLGLEVRGIDPQWPRFDAGALKYFRALEGNLSLNSVDEVWIGREAASKLSLHPGDVLRLLTTRTKGNLTVPRVTTVKIAAVVTVGYQELDRLWLFMPLELSASLFDVRENPIFWGIKADVPLDKTADFLREVRAVLGSKWQAVSWQTTGRSQFLNYQATRALLAIVMALVLLVAAVNVSTAMVTTVSERRRETAILKALGATDTLIRRQFLVLGFAAGVLGTALGIAIGVALAVGINTIIGAINFIGSLLSGGAFQLMDSTYYLETIPVHLDVATLACAAAGSIALAMLASWLPSRRAGKERPLEVLRRV